MALRRARALGTLAHNNKAAAPLWDRDHEGALQMPKRLWPAVAGAAFIVASVAAPAAAADVEATATVCAGCHGASGVPTDPKTMPIIWGQQSNYLYKELHDYHSGDRANAIMTPLAKPFSFDDLRQVANYFAAKTWPANPSANAAAAAPEGSAMCMACHGQTFQGGEPAPRLAGLSSDYLLAQMNNFADGTRTNNLDMPKFMRDLSASQRDAIAHYLAGL
jgi:cytochrome c553